MKALSWFIVAALVIASGAVQAEDSDEMLNLLQGGKEGKAKVKKEEDFAIQTPLRRLVSSVTAEQNIFFQFFDRSEYEKALFQWPSAFEGTAFAKTANGIALLNWLIFREGISLYSLEQLLSVNPKDVAPELLQMWRQVLPDSHPVWDAIASSRFSKAWTETFGFTVEVKLWARDPEATLNEEQLKEVLVKTKPNTTERALLAWQLVHAQMEKDLGAAGQTLSVLMKQSVNPISQDLMNLLAARMLYERGYLDAAIKYYGYIPKKSDYWFEAQEEISWSHLRKTEPQNAIAITRTLIQTELAALAGPEMFLVRSMAQLKVCDYEGTVATLKDFRTQMKPRTEKLLKLTSEDRSEVLESVLAELRKGPVTWDKLKSRATALPRDLTRDRELQQLLRIEMMLENESAKGAELFGRSITGGSDQVGFQARWERLRWELNQRLETAHVAVRARAKEMAKEEIAEIHKILQRLHMVEAEVLTQSTLASRAIESTKNMARAELKGADPVGLKAPASSSSASLLRFPVEKEVWFDELAHFTVDVKGACQVVK